MVAIESLSRVSRPLNVGHRGASALAPENTLAAFREARAVGADGIEFDVQFSRDRQLIVFHDKELERITGIHGLVAEKTLAELKQLDAGSWFDAKFAGDQIPTLDEVFDLLDGQMLLNIEIKSDAQDEMGLEAAVVDCVQRNHLTQHVLISSFDLACLTRVRQIDPSIRIGVLFDKPLSDSRLASLNAEALHPNWKMVDEQMLQRAHERGQQVNVWTVNAPADMQRMISLGVDGIITNFPHSLKKILDEKN